MKSIRREFSYCKLCRCDAFKELHFNVFSKITKVIHMNINRYNLNMCTLLNASK